MDRLPCQKSAKGRMVIGKTAHTFPFLSSEWIFVCSLGARSKKMRERFLHTAPNLLWIDPSLLEPALGQNVTHGHNLIARSLNPGDQPIQGLRLDLAAC